MSEPNIEETTDEKSKTPSKKRWKMPTRAFVKMWNDAINRDDGNDWRTFCMACFVTFKTDPELFAHNHKVITAEVKNVDDDDEVYTWISKKCYAKCVNIRGRLKKAGKIVTLPNGWRDRPRPGGKREERLDILDIAALFTN